MATYAVSVEFIVNAKTDEKAEEIATRIGNYVVQEKMATEADVVDIELREDEEAEELDFEEDDE